jgi:DNA-binding transcriptional ArsR family regulator
LCQAELKSILKLMDALLDVVAEPRRREILRLVWDRELSSGEIATGVREITWAAVSQHLRILRDAGVVTERRAGTRRYYRADRRALGPLKRVLREMWETDLHRLAREAKAAGKSR